MNADQYNCLIAYKDLEGSIRRIINLPDPVSSFTTPFFLTRDTSKNSLFTKETVYHTETGELKISIVTSTNAFVFIGDNEEDTITDEQFEIIMNNDPIYNFLIIELNKELYDKLVLLAIKALAEQAKKLKPIANQTPIIANQAMSLLKRCFFEILSNKYPKIQEINYTIRNELNI